MGGWRIYAMRRAVCYISRGKESCRRARIVSALRFFPALPTMHRTGRRATGPASCASRANAAPSPLLLCEAATEAVEV